MIVRPLITAAALSIVLPVATSHALISFGPPGALNSTAATDSADPSAEDVDTEPAVANDGGSTWVAVWSSDNSLGGTIGTDSDILFARSTDDGATWSSAAALYANAATDGAASDTEPRVAAGASNVWVAVFASKSDLAGGTADNDILLSRSTNDGVTWSNPIRLNNLGAADTMLDEDFQPSVATDGAGNWVVVWKLQALGGPTFNQTYFAFSDDNGASWSTQQTLGSQQTANIGLGQGTAVVYAGQFIAAWGSTESVSGNGNDGDILFSRIDTLAFTPTSPELLNDNGVGDTGADIYPSLAVTGSIGVAVWESNENLSGSGTDDDILISRTGDSGATWSTAEPLANNATTDTGDDERPSIASDGNTSYLVVWHSDDSLDKVTKTDGDILIVRSTDEGATWSDVGPLSSTAGKDKGADALAAIAANGTSDTWVAVWESSDTLFNTIGADEDVLFSRAAQDCPSTPVAANTCFETIQAGASSITIKEGGAKDSITWKWNKGEDVDKAADIGNPMTTDSYVFCLYDETAGTPELVTELDIPAGGNCFANACWKETTPGYGYKHKYGSASGLSLFSGTGGKAKASVKAKTGFAAPPMPINQNNELSARLHNVTNGRCWAADYTSNSANDGSIYKAKN